MQRAIRIASGSGIGKFGNGAPKCAAIGRLAMNKPNAIVGVGDAADCSTAIKVLELLRNTIEKEAGIAMARADNMEGVIRSQWIMKFNTLSEVINLIDMTIKSIPAKNPYENCQNFSEVCQTFFETDPQMQKFFGTNKNGK